MARKHVWLVTSSNLHSLSEYPRRAVRRWLLARGEQTELDAFRFLTQRRHSIEQVDEFEKNTGKYASIDPPS